MTEEILHSIKKEQEITNSLLEIIANRIERNRKSVVYSSDNSKDDLLKRIEELSEENILLKSRAEQAEKSSNIANEESDRNNLMLSNSKPIKSVSKRLFLYTFSIIDKQDVSISSSRCPRIGLVGNIPVTMS